MHPSAGRLCQAAPLASATAGGTLRVYRTNLAPLARAALPTAYECRNLCGGSSSDSPLEGALHENSRFLVKAQSFRAGKNSYELLAPIHNRLR